jgi:plasmid maintenance system killer protein
MHKITDILITNDYLNYLQKRNLIKQFKKAKIYILLGQSKNTKFKERNPKGSGIYYFRINKQFSALGYFENSTLIIFEIDNHQ